MLRDVDDSRRSEVAASLGAVATPEAPSVTAPPEADAVVLALPAGGHAAAALPLVERGVPVISTSDAVGDVEALLDLGPLAEAAGSTQTATRRTSSGTSAASSTPSATASRTPCAIPICAAPQTRRASAESTSAATLFTHTVSGRTTVLCSRQTRNGRCPGRGDASAPTTACLQTG